MSERPLQPEVRELQLPLALDQARSLQLGELVTLSGRVTVSIGIPTHKRLAQAAKDRLPTPVDLRGGAFLHLSTYVQERDGVATPLYLNPSTSTRYNEWMPAIVQGLGPRILGGKGGLNDASVAALKASGAVYLSFLGGGSPLLSRALRGVSSMHWCEYISQFRLLTLDVQALGPAVVAIDAHGNSIYHQVADRARARMPAILSGLAAP